MSADFRERLSKQYKPVANANNIADMWMSGRHYGTARNNFLGDFASRDELQHEIIARNRALGPWNGGLKPLDQDGKEIPNATFYYDLLGKVVSTDEKGAIIITNQEKVDQAIEDYLYMESRIDDVVDMCLVSNALAGQILNLKTAELTEQLKAGKDVPVEGVELDEDTKKVDGTPNSIRQTAPGSQLYLNKLAKLRALVRNRLPYVNIASFGFKKSDKNNKNLQKGAPNKFDTDTQENLIARGLAPAPEPEEPAGGQGQAGGQPVSK